MKSPDKTMSSVAQPVAASAPRAARFRLVRYFMLTSIAAFLLFAAALVRFEYLDREQFEQVQREQNVFFAQLQDRFVQRHDSASSAYLMGVYEAGNVSLGRLFANALWENDVAPFVAKAQRISADHCRAMADAKGASGNAEPTREKSACYAEVGSRIMALPEFRVLEAKVFDTMKSSTVFKIKVFDLRGITVYSSEHGQVGEDKLGNPAWESAKAGKPMSQLSFRDQFTAFEGVVTNRDLVSSYIPVRAPRTGSIVGVLEVYSDVTEFLRQIRSTSVEIRKLIGANQAQFEHSAATSRDKVAANANLNLALSFGMLVLLFLVLFAIVRHAQRTIDKQDLERSRNDAEMARQRDLYAMLSHTNKTIVRVRGREELFATVCRVAVEYGHFRFAWIGLRGKADAPIEIAARHGEDAGYLQRIAVSADPSDPIGRSPTGQVLSAGQHAISNDFLNDPATSPSHDAARRAGVRASAAFPIREGGELVGALSVYAAEPAFFTSGLLATLDEIAMDVSFALDNFARETARGDAVKALQESEERFRNLLRDAPSIAVQGYGMDGVTRYWNHASERLYGYTAQEAIGRPLVDLIIPPELRSDVAQAIRQMSETGQTIPAAELSLMRKDGSRVTVFSSHAMVQVPGHARELFCIDVDLTESKQAERLLRASEERYRRIYDSLQDVYIETALDGTILEISPKIEQLMKGQYKREDLLGKRAGDLYADPRAREVVVRGLVEHGRIIDAEVDLRNRDGSTVSCSISAMLSVDAEGESKAIISTLRDITERKHAQRALAEANVQFQAMVEQSIAGIYIIQDGKFAYVNPRFCEIHGYASQDELVGIDPLSLIVEKDRDATMDAIRKLLDEKLVHLSHTLTALRKDGSTVELGINSARATYHGRPAIIAMLQDISEKKRAEEQIQRYVVQLRTAFMQTVEVATSLSEMRDPYTAGHERRVAEIAVAIGRELGLDARQQEGLRVAGYLHDIGKITIPSEILSKPGKLSSAEFMLIKGHPQAGYDVLKGVDFPWPVAQVALQHHERMDGSGYPQGLKGEAIPVEARIMAVADVIEAMSSHRPYRPGLGIGKALAEIERGRGSAYDPRVADACLRLFREMNYAIPA